MHHLLVVSNHSIQHRAITKKHFGESADFDVTDLLLYAIGFHQKLKKLYAPSRHKVFSNTKNFKKIFGQWGPFFCNSAFAKNNPYRFALNCLSANQPNKKIPKVKNLRFTFLIFSPSN